MLKRKAKPHIPQSPEEFTPEWFTRTLAARDAVVTRVQTETVGEGIGFIGDLFRCSLNWSDNAPELPRSVVVKVPSSVRNNRALGEALGAYEREILIYRDIGDGLGIPMPDYVHSELDPHPAPWMFETLRWLMDTLPVGGVNWLINRLLNLPDSSMRRYVLVMEDIDDARPAAQFEGGNLEDALAALEVLARFHATNWMRSTVVDNTPLVWRINRTPKVYQATYRRNRRDFVDRFGAVVGTKLIEQLDHVQSRVPEMLDHLATEPWTILHGDYRLDNILYRSNGELVVLDYQLLTHGRPGWDVAYFITTALSPDHRSDEDHLLRTYHEALVDSGVGDYSFEQLVSDTRLSKELLAHRMVSAGDVIRTEVEGRDESLMDLLVTRVAAWVDL